jgi:hypothetical protein
LALPPTFEILSNALNDSAESSFVWEAITRDRQGQPLFELYGGLI